MLLTIIKVILAIYSALALLVFGLSFSGLFSIGDSSLLSLLAFLSLYCLVPLLGFIGIRKHQLGLLFPSLLLFASVVIRSIGQNSLLPFNPPLTLGIEFGDFAAGEGKVFDVFSLSMCALIALSLYFHFRSRHREQSKT